MIMSVRERKRNARDWRLETDDYAVVVESAAHVTFGYRRPGALCLALLIGLATRATVHAQSPDTPTLSDAAIGSTFSQTLLRGLPISNNVYSLFETTDGEITSDRFYGGGLNTGRPARDGAFLNSWRQSQFFVGDVNVTIPNGGAPFLFPVVMLWQRVDVATGLMPLGFNTPAVAVSLDPARPSTSWTRIIEASGAGKSLVARPSSSVAPPIETLTQWSHGDVFLSGPVSPRVGLVAAIDWAGASQVERSGIKEADGQAASAFANLVFTRDQSHELRTVGWVQRTKAPFPAAEAFLRPLLADETTFAHIQSTWEQHSANAATWRVFGAYSQANASRNDTLPAAAAIERLTDGPVPNLVDSGDRTDRQWSAGVRVATAPRGAGTTHTFLGGADVIRSSARIGPGYTGTIGEAIDGTPARLWQYLNNGSDGHRHVLTATAFVGDRIGFSPGRALELGVAYDGVTGSADQAANGITWQNALPYVSLRWKQGESSHFTWVAGYRRAVDSLTLDTLAVGDPSAPSANVFRWTVQGAGPLVARVGPGTAGDPAFSAIDPSLARPTTDEVVAGVEAQLTPNIRGRITGIAKRTNHLYNLVDVGAPLSSYTVFNVVDGRPPSDGGDTLLPVYSRLPSTFGADRYLLTNNSEDGTATFEGLTLNAEASLRRLTVMINATASQTDGPATNRGFHVEENDLGGIGELFGDPNATPDARGRLFFDRAFTLKISGVFEFPYGVTLGAIARYQDGQPFSRVTVVPGATTPFQLAQGTEFVRAFAAGDARFMYTGTLDLRLQKRFAIGPAAVDLFADGYNVINMGNEVEERVVTGPGFRNITAIQPPLAVHVGVRLNF
jgi:hypothetical protein